MPGALVTSGKSDDKRMSPEQAGHSADFVLSQFFYLLDFFDFVFHKIVLIVPPSFLLH